MNIDRCSSRVVHQEKVDFAILNDLEQREVAEISQFLKVFSDSNRLRMLHALLQQEMCVCDLAAFLDVSESAVSHQLRLLRTMGLVVNRREGTVLYYRLLDNRLEEMIALALTLCENYRQ